MSVCLSLFRAENPKPEGAGKKERKGGKENTYREVADDEAICTPLTFLKNFPAFAISKA